MTWCALSHRALLKVSGPDAKTFLQGLLTNDLQKLSSARPLYSAFLTPQGKFLHDLFISEKDEELYLEGERARLPDLFKRLSLFKLRANVTLTPLPDLLIFVLLDSSEGHKPQVPLMPQPDVLLSFLDPRPGTAWYRSYCLPGFTPDASLPFKVYNEKRLALGLPEGSWDMTPEKSIPLECGLDDLGAIDWEKGCYLGQELSARTKHQGLVRKRFLPVTSQETLEGLSGKDILQGDTKVGTLLSTEGSYALARLKVDALPFARATATSPLTVEGHEIVAHPPPWVNFPRK